jgi:adenosylcobinamide kinase / adenosylcobinamide-phosphate guanylyltransferase
MREDLPPSASASLPVSASGQPPLTLLGGAVRSGKSRFALQLACELGPRRTFVATAEPLDAEMALRIARHRAERAALGFVTLEEPVALGECIESLWGPSDEGRGGGGRPGGASPPDVVIVDCLTLWISNLLVRGEVERAIWERVERLRAALRARRSQVILVSNEVGMGLVPETALGRTFRDVMGELHQRLASDADRIYLGTMGLLLRLHPPPIASFRP